MRKLQAVVVGAVLSASCAGSAPFINDSAGRETSCTTEDTCVSGGGHGDVPLYAAIGAGLVGLAAYGINAGASGRWIRHLFSN